MKRDLIAASRKALSSSSMMSESKLSFSSSRMNFASRRNENWSLYFCMLYIQHTTRMFTRLKYFATYWLSGRLNRPHYNTAESCLFVRLFVRLPLTNSQLEDEKAKIGSNISQGQISLSANIEFNEQVSQLTVQVTWFWRCYGCTLQRESTYN